MKISFAALTVAVALALSAVTALAAEDAKGPAGGAGRAVGGAIGNATGGTQHAARAAAGGVEHSANNNRDGAAGDRGRTNVDINNQGKVNVDAGRGTNGANIDVSRGRVGVDVNRGPRITDRNAFVERNGRLGDRDFDRRRIGVLDDRAFVDRRDNNWRYRRWGNEWWYWMPGGYWSFYRDGRWNRYDVDTYVDDYGYSDQSTVAANSSGPYYEDQNGFYYFQNGRRLYDPQIRRIGSAMGQGSNSAPR